MDGHPPRERPHAVTEERFCHITTTGRVTGKPHEIEIWFVRRADTVFILMGRGPRDTARNLEANPAASVRIGDATFNARGRVVTDPFDAAWVRAELPRKYEDEEDGLEEWAEHALPVAFDLEVSSAASP